MRKGEFDYEDPIELTATVLLSEEDTTGPMAECLIEEFMRMGYGHRQILALFRNPHYLGPHMVLEKRGELFIRTLIIEVFGRWGRKASWPDPGSDQHGESFGSSAPFDKPATSSADVNTDATHTDPMGAPIPTLNR